MPCLLAYILNMPAGSLIRPWVLKQSPKDIAKIFIFGVNKNILYKFQSKPIFFVSEEILF